MSLRHCTEHCVFFCRFFLSKGDKAANHEGTLKTLESSGESIQSPHTVSTADMSFTAKLDDFDQLDADEKVSDCY